MLVKKGLITDAEYLQAIAEGMEAEQHRLEYVLSKKFKTTIKLG